MVENKTVGTAFAEIYKKKKKRKTFDQIKIVILSWKKGIQYFFHITQPYLSKRFTNR